VFAVAVLCLRWFGEQAGVREAARGQTAVAAIALAALYAMPALLVLFARHGRPGLLIAAGAVGVVLVPTTFSISPLLLIPSLLLFSVAPSTRRGPLLVVALVVLTIASFGAWIRTSEDVCYSGSAGSGCSELPPVSSSLLSLSITVAAIGGAWVDGRERAVRTD
jgi:hypothetical protein